MTLPLVAVPIDAQADTRVYIVESRLAGELQTRVVARGVRVIKPATDAEAAAR